MKLTAEIKPYLAWSIFPMACVVAAHFVYVLSGPSLFPIASSLSVGIASLMFYRAYSLWKWTKLFNPRTEVAWKIEDATQSAILEQLTVIRKEMLQELQENSEAAKSGKQRVEVMRIVGELDSLIVTIRNGERQQFMFVHRPFKYSVKPSFTSFLMDYLISRHSPRIVDDECHLTSGRNKE